jgi:hypothetical protein
LEQGNFGVVRPNPELKIVPMLSATYWKFTMLKLWVERHSKSSILVRFFCLALYTFSLTDRELAHTDRSIDPFDRITEKEKATAKSFLSAETFELLKTYMPTLKAENPYSVPEQ